MGALKAGSKRVLVVISMVSSWLAAFFAQTRHLHKARFARLHEVYHLLTPNLEDLHTSLLLGISHFNHFACVRPTKTRQELGNLLICAPTRAGKGLLAITQLLSWKHSVIVNDIKGELYTNTAGYRATLGPVYVIDPTAGVGHQYDPFAGRKSERELYASAKHLLFEPKEGDGVIFTQKAEKMLTQLFRAARLENEAAGKEQYRLLPYVGQMVNAGLKGAAERLQTISPELATKFLAGEFQEANFEDDRFMLSCWGTLDARLWPLLTDDVVRCFDGSDFSASQLMLSPKPVSLYLRFPESDLHALSPLVRLLWGSLIDELITTYDQNAGKGCNPVLLLADEAGKTAIPMLSDAASTVVGRRIYLWIAVQSLSQLETVYGRARAQALRDNVENQLYYRPTDTQTAKYLEDRLGSVSAYAHSQTLHSGEETSEGLSERPIPLLASQDIGLLSDDQVLAFHRNHRPMRLRRCDWRDHPVLAKRRSIPPPRLSPLPHLNHRVSNTLWQRAGKAHDGYIDPDKRY